MEELKFIKLTDILEALRGKARVMFEKDTARGVRCVTLADLEQTFHEAKQSGVEAEEAYEQGCLDGYDNGATDARHQYEEDGYL